MALEEEVARPRLLIVRGSFATMGGAERELLQLIRMAHDRWDVHLATLDITPEAEALMLPAQPSLIKPPTSLKWPCLLYTSPSPRDRQKSRMPSSA